MRSRRKVNGGKIKESVTHVCDVLREYYGIGTITPELLRQSKLGRKAAVRTFFFVFENDVAIDRSKLSLALTTHKKSTTLSQNNNVCSTTSIHKKSNISKISLSSLSLCMCKRGQSPNTFLNSTCRCGECYMICVLQRHQVSV